MADLHTLSYLETDIPAGMTLAEYRRRRAEPVEPRPSQRVLVQIMRYARWQVRRPA